MENINLSYEKENLSPEIKMKYMTPIFNDPFFERDYLSDVIQKGKTLFYFYSIIIILVNIGLLIYGCFYTSNKAFYISLGTFIGVNILLIIVHSRIDSLIPKSYLQITNYLTIWISLIVTLFCFIFEENILETKKTRLISLIILIKNFSLLIWSRTNIFLWITFFFINLAVILSSSFLMKDHIFEDITVEIITCVASFGMRNYYDYALRNSFLEINKFKSKFEYSEKLINSMSGLHITFSGNRLVFMNDNVKSLLLKMNKSDKLRSKIFIFIFILLFFNY